eukprot:jgi/Tetstr1/453763/TSEL_040715.t1
MGGSGEPATATVTLPGGETLSLPLLTDAAGGRFLDVRGLYASSGLCCFDPGFGSTASCESAITFIDGAAGLLLYRGYPIQQLAEKGDIVDCALLLFDGELPSAEQRLEFQTEARAARMVHESLIKFYSGFRSDAHPMAIMVGVVGALSSFFNDSFDVTSEASRRACCINIVAKMPTLAAIAYKTSVGEPVVYPRDDMSFAENFLYMMHARPCSPYVRDPVAARCLEVIMILHADHEQNASTSTVRIAGSSQANPFACIASGIASLWGPAHGGANEAVLRMLREIGTPDNVAACVARAKDKADPFRLMGFGHRLYKAMDPRAKLMREMCGTLLAHLQLDDPLLHVAQALEEVALQDDYFVSRKLYPNVDFYSGICFRALGIPEDMMTVIFAVSRSIGWCAQWNESMSGGLPRISRPRQMFTGVAAPRTYESPTERGCPAPGAPGGEDDGSGMPQAASGPVRSLSIRHARARP